MMLTRQVQVYSKLQNTKKIHNANKPDSTQTIATELIMDPKHINAHEILKVCTL